jgi:polar amino acid transport system substrate-binding protein
MKKTLLFLLTILILLSTNLYAQAKTLKLVTYDKEDFPAIIGNSKEINPKTPGAYVDFVKVLGKKLGVNITLTRLSQNELTSIIKTGNARGYDGYIADYYTPDRDRVTAFPMKNGMPDYSKSLFIDRFYFYKNKKSSIKWNGVYLTNINKGLGTSFDESVQKEMKLDGYNFKEGFCDDLIKELAEDKLDAVLSVDNNMDHFLALHPEIAKNITKLQPQFSARPFFVILSNDFVKNNPELANRLWFQVGQLRGEYLKLEKKYYSNKYRGRKS